MHCVNAKVQLIRVQHFECIKKKWMAKVLLHNIKSDSRYYCINTHVDVIDIEQTTMRNNRKKQENNNDCYYRNFCNIWFLFDCTMKLVCCYGLNWTAYGISQKPNAWYKLRLFYYIRVYTEKEWKLPMKPTYLTEEKYTTIEK